MLRNWLKIAFINYKKNWLSTFINLFGLTLGLTGFMLILLHWNDEASYEQWNPQKKDIYFLQQYYKTEDWTNNNMSYQMTKTATDELPEIEDFVMFAYDNKEGLMKTNSGKTLVFSLLINNYAGSVDQVKSKMEQLLQPALSL